MQAIIIELHAADDDTMRHETFAMIETLIIGGQRAKAKALLRICARKPMLLLGMVMDAGTMLGGRVREGRPVDISTHAHAADWCENPSHDAAQQAAQAYVDARAAEERDCDKTGYQVIRDYLGTFTEETAIEQLVCLAAFLLDADAVFSAHELRDRWSAEPEDAESLATLAKFADAHPVGAK